MQWAMEVTADDKVAVVFPITHVGGLVWMFNAMETGCELLVVEIFSPDATPAFLAEHGVTCAGAGTVFWQAYLAAQRTQPGTPLFPDVRMFNGGGAPKPPNIHDELMQEMGAPVMSGLGPHRDAHRHDAARRRPRRAQGARPRAGPVRVSSCAR